MPNQGRAKKAPGEEMLRQGTAPGYSLLFRTPVRCSGHHPLRKVRDPHCYSPSAKPLSTFTQEVADKGSASSCPAWYSVHKPHMQEKSHNQQCRYCSVHREGTFQLLFAWKAEIIMGGLDRERGQVHVTGPIGRAVICL